jgi:hypothetical protein
MDLVHRNGEGQAISTDHFLETRYYESEISDLASKSDRTIHAIHLYIVFYAPASITISVVFPKCSMCEVVYFVLLRS